MDDLGVPLFQETSMCVCLCVYACHVRIMCAWVDGNFHPRDGSAMFEVERGCLETHFLWSKNSDRWYTNSNSNSNKYNWYYKVLYY